MASRLDRMLGSEKALGLTMRAIELIEEANEISLHLREKQLKTEHILISIVRDGGFASIVLEALGVDTGKIGIRVIRSWDQDTVVPTTFKNALSRCSDTTQRVLMRAAKLARSNGHLMNSGHILLAICSMDCGARSMLGRNVHFEAVQKKLEEFKFPM